MQTTRRTSLVRSLRITMVTIALALASIGSSASADVLAPSMDAGGPGGSSGFVQSDIPAPQAKGPQILAA